MNGVRDAMYNLRYQWLSVRIGGPGATLRGQGAVLSVSLLLVFGCFFAVGRLRHSGGAVPASAPSALEAPDGQGAVPAGLSGGSPIAGAVPVAIAVKPHPRPAPQPAVSEAALRAASPVQPAPGISATTGELSSSESQAATVPAAESVSAPAPVKPVAPTPSSARAPAPHSESSKAATTPSSGGSFDSSG
jgi:hypothetical protein